MPTASTTSNLRIDRRTKTLVIAIAVVALLATMVGAADAYVRHGCEYDNDSISPISYRFFSVGSTYETAFGNGEYRWDITSAPGYFKEHSTSWDPEINVTDGVYVGDYFALTTWGCSGGFYTGNETNVRFDTGDTSGWSALDLKNLAIHELAHVYGLDDVGGTSCRVANYGVVYPTPCASTFPRSDDISGVTAIYP